MKTFTALTVAAVMSLSSMAGFAADAAKPVTTAKSVATQAAPQKMAHKKVLHKKAQHKKAAARHHKVAMKKAASAAK